MTIFVVMAVLSGIVMLITLACCRSAAMADRRLEQYSPERNSGYQHVVSKHHAAIKPEDTRPLKARSSFTPS